MNGVLTSIFKMDSEKGKEIGGGFTYFCHEFHKFLNLPEDKKQQIFEPIISVMKKLGKVAEAIDRYEDLEEVKMAALTERLRKDTSSITLTHQDSSTELEGLIEEVISNSKSALDSAVKILQPLWSVNLVTYENAGRNVVKALKNNVPKDSQSAISNLIILIESNEPWIRNLRDQRTQSEHYGKTLISPLSAMNIDGKIQETYPSINGKSAKEFINKIYDDIFIFLQDFIILALSSRFYGGLLPVIANNETGRKRKFGVAIVKEAISQ